MGESLNIDSVNRESSNEHLARQACLIAIEGGLSGQVFKLQEHNTLIGRGNESDVVLGSSDVSRSHAMITRHCDKYLISDLKSTNGTTVNRKKVSHPTVLVEGDRLSIGDLKFRFAFVDEIEDSSSNSSTFASLKDQLTGIYNKRYFMDLAKNEFDYCRRRRDKLGLILFDIDDLRLLIDRLGSEAGEQILKAMASLVDSSARSHDLFARYSKDEFIFLIRGTEPEQLVYIADRIRKMVADARFAVEDEDVNITLSLGVASYDGGFQYDGVAQFLAAADQNLDRARESGRNSIYA